MKWSLCNGQFRLFDFHVHPLPPTLEANENTWSSFRFPNPTRGKSVWKAEKRGGLVSNCQMDLSAGLPLTPISNTPPPARAAELSSKWLIRVVRECSILWHTVYGIWHWHSSWSVTRAEHALFFTLRFVFGGCGWKWKWKKEREMVFSYYSVDKSQWQEVESSSRRRNVRISAAHRMHSPTMCPFSRKCPQIHSHK